MDAINKIPQQYRPTGNLCEATKGRWREIFSVLAPELSNADDALFTEKNLVSCPAEHDSATFRLSKCFNETGAAVCSECGPFENGFKLFSWLLALREKKSSTVGITPDKIRSFYQAAHLSVAYYLEHPSYKNQEMLTRVARSDGQLGPVAADSAGPPETAQERRRKIMAMAKDQWVNGLTNSEAAENYLAELGVTEAAAPPLLRFNAGTPYITETRVSYLPAFLLPVTRMDDGMLKMVGIAKTYVSQNVAGILRDSISHDAKKIIKWSDLAGACVRVYPLEGSTTLALAKDIETATAIHTLTGLPCWAGLTYKGFSLAQIPDDVVHVILVEDYDPLGFGQYVTREKADALRTMGKEVTIMSPSTFYEPGNPTHESGITWHTAVAADRQRSEALWAPFVAALSPSDEEILSYDAEKK